MKRNAVGKEKIRFLMLVLTVILFVGFTMQKTVDRIVVVVDNQVITLTDLRVCQEFQLFRKDQGEEAVRETIILKRLINQKLVKQLNWERVNLEKKKVEEELEELKERWGEERFQSKLLKFGLEPEDLKEYIREKILFNSIIKLKFENSVIVNLQDIEDYYREEYVPFQEKKGRKPLPLTDILEEIESRVKEKKVEQQAENWLRNLREEAKIHIKLDEYKNIWNRSG